MSVSIENQLWLAAHLLYPNSSQAFDVYQAIMTQIINTPKNNNYQFIIEKLFEISQKVEPVKSNQPFHSLDGNPIDQWMQIYNKSQKNQLVIVIGVLIFKLSFAQIAQFSKLKPEKVYYLFQQVFKKNISLSTTPVRQTAIHLKKVTEQRVSFLFTYENLIDFCLETLNPKDVEQIKTGLQFYPELQVVEKKYKQIIQQLELTNHIHLHIVTGMVKDKDVDAALALMPKQATYYFTQAHIPRAMDAIELQKLAANHQLIGNVFPDVNTAIEAAKNHVHKDDLILVCGSVFLVGEINILNTKN